MQQKIQNLSSKNYNFGPLKKSVLVFLRKTQKKIIFFMFWFDFDFDFDFDSALKTMEDKKSY